MQSTKKLAVLVGMVASQGCLSHLYPIHKCRQLLVPTAVLHGVIFLCSSGVQEGIVLLCQVHRAVITGNYFFSKSTKLGSVIS